MGLHSVSAIHQPCAIFLVIFSFGARFYIHPENKDIYGSCSMSVTGLSIKLDGGYESFLRNRDTIKHWGLALLLGNQAELGQCSKVGSS